MELYAQWGDAPCTLTWNANGGTPAIQTTSVSNNSAIGTLPKATRAAYTLNGWYTATSGGVEITNTTKVTGNATYYAHWTPKTWTNNSWAGTSILEDYNWSPEKRVFSNIPKASGTFTLTLNDIKIQHYGKYSDHEIYMFVILQNAANTSTYKYLSLTNGQYELKPGSPYRIKVGSKTVSGQNVNTVYATNLNRNAVGSETFKLTVNNVTIPYTNTHVAIELYTGNSSCTGSSISLASGGFIKLQKN